MVGGLSGSAVWGGGWGSGSGVADGGVAAHGVDGFADEREGGGFDDDEVEGREVADIGGFIELLGEFCEGVDEVVCFFLAEFGGFTRRGAARDEGGDAEDAGLAWAA